MKALLVGEANPYGRDPLMALYPYPAQSAGGRLCKLLGMSTQAYLNTFDRVNLYALPPRKWSDKLAAEHAERVLREHPRSFPIVLLGRRVATAFGFKTIPFFREISRLVDVTYCTFIIVPHPSGRCHIWNDEATVAELRRLLDHYIKEKQ